MAKITVGPVIGKVTDTTARVLIEVDDDADVTCTITSKGGDSAKNTASFKAGRPSVFAFKKLQPNTEYAVAFTGLAGTSPKGRIRTFATNTDSLNIAAVSCNFLGRRGKRDLWADLRDRYVLPGDVNLVLHIGDQIYGDAAFARSLRIINDKEAPSVKEQNNLISETYRNNYRAWWSEQATRDVLANVSNLMIWDDHEIRDDWGSKPTDCDKNSIEFRIGTLARQVYREYQRQLWDDFNPNSIPPTGEEQHFHIWGSIAVLFLDQRGGRSFGREPSRPYLSKTQWEKLVALLETGELSKVRALIVVTSVPLIYLGNKTTEQGTGISDDLYDHWSHPINAKEQIEMLRELRLWKGDPNATQKELLVVGGDVHVGGYTQIKHEKKEIFRQLITSPITNHPPKFFEFLGLRVLTEGEESLTTSYSFEHSGLTNKRNYGIILVRVPQTGQPRVEGTLVKET
jgi:hypothetical protein